MLLVHLVKMDQLEVRVQLEQQEALAPQVELDQLAGPDFQETQDLVDPLVSRVRLEHQVVKDLPEAKDRPVRLVFKVQLVEQEPQDWLEQQDSAGHPELQVRLDSQVRQVGLDKPVSKVALGRQGLLELLDQEGRKVLPETKAILEMRGLLASKELPG